MKRHNYILILSFCLTDYAVMADGDALLDRIILRKINPFFGDDKEDKKKTMSKDKEDEESRYSFSWNGYYLFSVAQDGSKMIFHQQVKNAKKPPVIINPPGEWFEFVLKYDEKAWKYRSLLRDKNGRSVGDQGLLQEAEYESQKTFSFKTPEGKPLSGGFVFTYIKYKDASARMAVHGVSDNNGKVSHTDRYIYDIKSDSFFFYPRLKKVFRIPENDIRRFNSGQSVTVTVGVLPKIRTALTVKDAETELPIKAIIEFSVNGVPKKMLYDGKTPINYNGKVKDKIRVVSNGYDSGTVTLNQSGDFVLLLMPSR